MKLKLVVWAMIFSVCHFLLNMSAVFLSLKFAFAGAGGSGSVWLKICNGASNTLIMPMSLLWRSGLTKDLPGFSDWIFLVSNSFIWGFAIAFLFSLIAKDVDNQAA